MNRLARQDGSTLIELMIGLTLTVLLLSAVFTLLSTSLLSWSQGSSKMEVQQTARFAVDSIVRDLKFASSITINSSTMLTLVTSQYTSTKTIVYTLDATTVNQKLRREDRTGGSGAQPVTGDTFMNASVSNLSFTPLATNQAGVVRTVGIVLTVNDPVKNQDFTIETAATAINVAP